MSQLHLTTALFDSDNQSQVIYSHDSKAIPDTPSSVRDIHRILDEASSLISEGLGHSPYAVGFSSDLCLCPLLVCSQAAAVVIFDNICKKRHQEDLEHHEYRLSHEHQTFKAKQAKLKRQQAKLAQQLGVAPDSLPLLPDTPFTSTLTPPIARSVSISDFIQQPNSSPFLLVISDGSAYYNVQSIAPNVLAQISTQATPDLTIHLTPELRSFFLASNTMGFSLIPLQPPAQPLPLSWDALTTAAAQKTLNSKSTSKRTSKRKPKTPSTDALLRQAQSLNIDTEKLKQILPK